MPRGKNYVNNNRGVSLQASKKKGASQMVACIYGAGCTRPDCIYRHPHGKSKKASVGGQGVAEYQSKEPCMPFLAGTCTFAAEGCRKRHPPRAEAERLIAKYRSTNCRFGDECRTKGCLYLHPAEFQVEGALDEPEYIPPPQTPPVCIPVASSSAWKPAMPGISGNYSSPQPQSNALSMSAAAPAYVPRSVEPAARAHDGPLLSAMAGEFVPGTATVAMTSMSSPSGIGAAQSNLSGGSPQLSSVDPWSEGREQCGNPWAMDGSPSSFNSSPSWK